jgi:acetate kinase
MSYILSINAGSTSVKYKLFDKQFNEVLFGHIEKFKGNPISKLKKAGKDYIWEISESEFKRPDLIIAKEIADYEIRKIGFRVVHGGEKFTLPTKLTDSIISRLEGTK